MRIHVVRLGLGCGLAVVLVGAIVAGAAGAVGPTASTWKLVPSPNAAGTDHDNFLNDVAALSSHNGWAVGYDFPHGGGSTSSTILRWNGSAWSIQSHPKPAGATDTQLNGIGATSPSNAWAVGQYATTGAQRTLILHWNGKGWKVQPSPNRGIGRNVLTEVAATSPSNAWAVGFIENGTGTERTLIEHWNGTSWTLQKAPNVGTDDNLLASVDATSASNAWAVGESDDGPLFHSLMLHWNGTAWKVHQVPHVSGAKDLLNGVDAISASNAWAVGDRRFPGGATRTLTLHWNGTAWKIQPSPDIGAVGANNGLDAVVATSASNAWAVGDYYTGSGFNALVMHWNGTAWKIQSTPGFPAADDVELHGVDATSSSDAWAVGNRSHGSALAKTVILHCC